MVRVDLATVGGEHQVNRLDLHQDETFDHDIRAVRAVDLQSAVDQRQGLLTLNLQPGLTQIVDQACGVGRLEEARSKHPMNVDRVRDDRRRDLIELSGGRFRHIVARSHIRA